MLGRSEAAEVLLGAHRGAENRAEDARSFVVEAFFGGAAVAETLQVRTREVVVRVGVGRRAAQAVGPGAHLDVKAVGRSFVVVAAAAPVADNHAVEAPFSLEDVAEKALVVAVELAVPEVVGAHYRPGSAVHDSRLERGQVDFIEGAVVHHRVGGGAARFLIVHGEVLHARGNSVALHALNIGHHELAGQIRVLAHILERAAVERGAAHIDARAEQDVLFAVARFLPYAVAVEP